MPPRLSSLVQTPLNPHLPIRRTIGRGVDALIDYVKQEDEGSLDTFIARIAGEEENVIDDQFRDKRRRSDLLKLGVKICCKDMGNNGRLFAFLNVIPSPLCRSNTPILHSGHALVEAATRAEGVFSDLVLYWTTIALREGYKGTLARIPVIATGMYTVVKRGEGHIMGCIPNSGLTANNEYTDDLVTHVSYANLQPLFKASCFDIKDRTNEPCTLPPMRRDAVNQLCHPVGPWGTQVRELLSASDKTLMTGTYVRLEFAGRCAIDVEQMVREAAESGEGFALDEFDDDGLLNRKFLRKRVSLVARRHSDGTLVGGAVIGPSNLQRGSRANSLGGYLVVGERFRGNGYGSDIADICERICKELGYSHILSDILYSPAVQPALRLAMRKGYAVTGQLPSCAFVKDVGMAGSFIVFKSFKHLSHF